MFRHNSILVDQANPHKKPSLVPSFPPSLHHVFYISKIQDGHTKKKKKYSVQGVGGRQQGGGGIGGGALYKKLGVQFFFFQLSRGPKGPSRWLKATSPLQELEVGAHRVLYLLVLYTRRYGALWAPTSGLIPPP